MKKIISDPRKQAREVRRIRAAIDCYYTAPLNAIQVEQQLREDYPALWDQCPNTKPDEYWSPIEESEVLIRLRWYLKVLNPGQEWSQENNKTA